MATLGIRVHARHWRLLAWLATTGVAACAGVMLWNIVKDLKGGKYVALSTSHFSDVIATSLGTIPSSDIRVADWKEYDRLVKSPINGMEVVKPVEAAAPTAPPPPSKKKIEDVLTLQVVTYAPEDLGRVVVKYKDDSLSPPPLKDQIVLGVGSKLAAPYDIEPFNATLKSIKPNTAIFDWCGEVVELHPTRREEVKSEKAAAGAGETKTSTSDQDKKDLLAHKDSDATLNLGNERYLVGKTDQANINTNGDKFLGELRIAERPGANKKPEVVLGNVRTNSYVARTYGLQNEDILISINGTAISSKSQGYQYVRDNPDLERYDVVIRRKGKDITKTVLVPRNKK